MPPKRASAAPAAEPKKRVAVRKSAAPFSTPEEGVLTQPFPDDVLYPSAEVDWKDPDKANEAKNLTAAVAKAPTWALGPPSQRTAAPLRPILAADPSLLMWLGASDQKRLAALVKEVVQADPMSLMLVRAPTKPTIELALGVAAYPFLGLTEEAKTAPICAAAVRLYPHLLTYCPARTPAVLKAAAETNAAEALEYAANEVEKAVIRKAGTGGLQKPLLATTEEGWVAAVTEEWELLQKCPPRFRSAKVLNAAFMANLTSIQLFTTAEQQLHTAIIERALTLFPPAIACLRAPTGEQVDSVVRAWPTLAVLVRDAYRTPLAMAALRKMEWTD